MRLYCLRDSLRRMRFLISVFLAFNILALNASAAFALQYQVGGYENQSSGTSIRWTGGHGYNYVMSGPNITKNHVNSIYMRRDDLGSGYYYEVGWAWQAGQEPKWFWARMVNGVYKGPFIKSTAPRNSNHLLSAQADSNEPGSPARLKVDTTVLYDSQVAGHGVSMFNDGVLVWGSERQCAKLCQGSNSSCPCICNRTDCTAHGSDSNYGHFWHLMKRRHDFAWIYWENHQMFTDNDPTYNWVKTSNTEGSSQ